MIASFYWDRVSNRAFVCSVLSAVVLFTIVRFELVPIQGAVAFFFELFSAIGGAVVLGLMAFGFLGRRIAIAVGAITFAVLLPFFIGTLRDYIVLMGSLTAYGVSATVCVALSLRNPQRFDFGLLAERVTSFHREQQAVSKPQPGNPVAEPVKA
ncbi:hypothetical protein D3C72_1825090 [compost metagenome]